MPSADRRISAVFEIFQVILVIRLDLKRTCFYLYIAGGGRVSEKSHYEIGRVRKIAVGKKQAYY